MTKKNGAQMVRDIWAKNGNAAAFPEVPPIRRHASKGTVNLVPVKDLCVVYDQQCAESICLDHLLAIMAILAGPGVYIHDVHTVPTDAKHKKRPDIVVSNQANQALLGINSALVGEVRTLHWYGERDHITQAARYIALTYSPRSHHAARLLRFVADLEQGGAAEGHARGPRTAGLALHAV